MKMQENDYRTLRASKIYQYYRIMVISNSTYSQVAKELARSNKCVLVDRILLIDWIATPHRLRFEPFY